MKAILTINEDIKNIPIIFDIKMSDYRDGTPDSLSFSFIQEEEITIDRYMKEKAVVKIYDEDDTLIRTHNMLITDINSNRNSMYDEAESGYFITIQLKEHTILLRDCVRTDISISPFLYPKLKSPLLDEGDEFNEINIYDNLYDAVMKIVDCHNMILYNEKIEYVDEEISNKLRSVACPTLTYKDLSTFEQLLDVFRRVGAVPYFENGILYGLNLQGKQPNIEATNSVKKQTSYETTKNNNDNYGAVSTKVENSFFDNESMIYPNVYRDNIMSNNDEYVIGTVSKEAYNNNNAQIISAIKEIYNDFVRAGQLENENRQNATVLFPSGFSPEDAGFNEDAFAIQDAKAYKLHLTAGIERIEEIYMLKPFIKKEENEDTINVGMKIIPIGTDEKGDLKYIYEKNFYDKGLTELQKKTNSYYKRGSREITNPLALIQDEVDSSFKVDFDDSLRKNWIGADVTLYNELRKSMFAIKYIPVKNTSYLSYSYNKNVSLDKFKPKSISTITLPYKIVSDKQVSNILSYELQKKLDTTYNVKLVTEDPNILKLEASDIIEFEGEDYIITTVDFTISRHSIDCSFKLNKKILVNNVISDYKDDIRVSDNISTQNLVYRDIPIYKENIISLSSTPEVNDKDNSLKFFEFDKRLKGNSFYNLGLLDKKDLVHTAKLDDIPFVTTLINEEDEATVGKVKHFIAIDDGSSAPIEVEFPLKIAPVYRELSRISVDLLENLVPDTLKTVLAEEFQNENQPIFPNPPEGSFDIIDTPEELATYLDEKEEAYHGIEDGTFIANNLRLRGLVFGSPESFTNSYMYPNTPITANYIGSLSAITGYTSGEKKSYKTYSTEETIKEISSSDILPHSSGNLFTIHYNYLNESTIGNSVFSNIDSLDEDEESEDYEDLTTSNEVSLIKDNLVLNTFPIFYNTMEYGCKLERIGNVRLENFPIVYNKFGTIGTIINIDTTIPTVSIERDNKHSRFALMPPKVGLSSGKFSNGKYNLKFDYELGGEAPYNLYLQFRGEDGTTNFFHLVDDESINEGSVDIDIYLTGKERSFEIVGDADTMNTYSNYNLKKYKSDRQLDISELLPFSSSKKGTYVDLREHINPYIQYTSIPKTIEDDEDLDIIELNNTINWLTINTNDSNKKYDYKLVKVNKGINISGFTLKNAISIYDIELEKDTIDAPLSNESVKLLFYKYYEYEDEETNSIKKKPYSLEKSNDYDYIIVRFEDEVRTVSNKDIYNINEKYNALIRFKYPEDKKLTLTDYVSIETEEIITSTHPWPPSVKEFNFDYASISESRFTKLSELDKFIIDYKSQLEAKEDLIGDNQAIILMFRYRTVPNTGGFLRTVIAFGEEYITKSGKNMNIDVYEDIIEQIKNNIPEEMDYEEVYVRLEVLMLTVEEPNDLEKEHLIGAYYKQKYKEIVKKEEEKLESIYLKYEITNNYELEEEE